MAVLLLASTLGTRTVQHGWPIETLIRIKSGARRIAANIAKLPELLSRRQTRARDETRRIPAEAGAAAQSNGRPLRRPQSSF